MKNQKAEPNNNQTKAKTSNTKTIPAVPASVG
jgi:hypothetical protein